MAARWVSNAPDFRVQYDVTVAVKVAMTIVPREEWDTRRDIKRYGP
jgi:hypothetical protein